MKKQVVILASLSLMGMIAGCRSQSYQKSSSSDASKSSKLITVSSSLNNQKVTVANNSAKIKQTTDDFKPIKPISLTDEQQQQIENEFLNWIGPRAKEANLAVCNYYFNHGCAERGNWYADTPSGRILVQDMGNSQNTDYVAQAIGGCLFYTSTQGTVGKTNEMDNACDADKGKYINQNKLTDRYLLANNGLVYELKAPANISSCSFYGFGEEPCGDSGIPQQGKWIISKDKAAQQELRLLLKPYEKNDTQTSSATTSSMNSNSNNQKNVWTVQSAQTFLQNMVTVNTQEQNSKFPVFVWHVKPSNNTGEKWYAVKNDGNTIEVASTQGGPMFTLIDNGNGTTTYKSADGTYQFLVRNSNYNVISSNYSAFDSSNS